jgi:hypothetical protein
MEFISPGLEILVRKEKITIRGFGYQGGASRGGWGRGTEDADFGVALKEKLQQPAGWL